MRGEPPHNSRQRCDAWDATRFLFLTRNSPDRHERLRRTGSIVSKKKYHLLSAGLEQAFSVSTTGFPGRSEEVPQLKRRYGMRLCDVRVDGTMQGFHYLRGGLTKGRNKTTSLAHFFFFFGGWGWMGKKVSRIRIQRQLALPGL